MNHKTLAAHVGSLTLVALLLTACSPAQPPSTPVPPAAAPPTAIPATPVPPSPVPPTPVPPTPIGAAGLGLNPSPRDYVSMAYDKESDRVILYGGQLNSRKIYFGDTWAYDVAANKWTEMKPASGPEKRGAVDLTYDAESDRVILFGGGNQSSWRLGDTWAYDYNTDTWQEMAPGPADHLGYRMAYDAESDRIILFGGLSVSEDKLLNDTWAYDFNSNTWTDLQPSISPSPRNYHAMAYDVESDRIILWGGDVQDRDPSVWAYDYNKNAWQKMAASGGPKLRYYMSMAYNAKADRIILYGGFGTGNDETWAYDYNADRWTKLAPAMTAGLR